ncbi:MAG: nitrate reductase [Pseudomonadota bacterium]
MSAQIGSASVKTTCPYCGVGCGVLVSVAGDGFSVTGDPEHPANFGRLCSKGMALGEVTSVDDRLLFPEIGGERVSWDVATNHIARTFSSIAAEHGSDAIAFYVSGQLLTEDYYVANKLMKGFIGSANIDTNSRLCMASSVAGHRRAFGMDTVPGTYADLEVADTVILVGSNLAWCHPVLFQRLAAAKAARPEMQIVLIDPRRTLTAELADLHLPIRADGDEALFVGLLRYLVETGCVDDTYITEHTEGFDDVVNHAKTVSSREVRERTGLDLNEIQRFYETFARSPHVVTVYSQGVNQSVGGTDKVNAIINCHLATGRIGRPGAGPFSVTGQPNAMGGREVGGLANMLAAHMNIEVEAHRERVQRFWRSPTIAGKPGLKAVDLFQAVGRGEVKALWIMATNPVDSLPDAHLVEAAVKACPFVIVSDVQHSTDTVRHAHVRLPAASWGEKDGTVTNSERRISRQRGFRAFPGEVKPDWWALAEVAKRMGFTDAFDYPSPASIFREHAALSGFENAGERDFNIAALADIDDQRFDRLQPIQWPLPPGDRGASADKRFFAEGSFFTETGRGRFVSPTSQLPPLDGDNTLLLNTGRIRDQWHTMTRTGQSARLFEHCSEPYAEIHPSDADPRGIADESLVVVSRGDRRIVVRAKLTTRVTKGSIFVPMHWTDQFASNARVGQLIPSRTDPFSGQPGLKCVAVEVERFAARWYGFAVVRKRPIPRSAYWAVAPASVGWRVELGLREDGFERDDAIHDFFCVHDFPGPKRVLRYRDDGNATTPRVQRIAAFAGTDLLGVLYLSTQPIATSRQWLAGCMARSFDSHAERQSVLAGRPSSGMLDPGPIICSCFHVGANQISAAIDGGCRDVDAVGSVLSAGTNCGSCRAEIQDLIDTQTVKRA